ncbi:nicotinate-nucleotide adenylyltransferase [Stackebrandtia soli]|uniref:nicotinate-nucleotide adenylyltransferase n=1 Tax=Stackebrandtia soli TaxID=1892856 RepID=UPI0039E8324D
MSVVRGSAPTVVDRRIGVMGGTFDPIHLGHLAAADEAAARLELDEVVFVPTGQPWQKTSRHVTAAEHRYAMTLLATADHPLFRVSRVEIDRPGRTYTVDTLRQLQSEYGTTTGLFFITGADAIANLRSWKAVDEVVELTSFVALNRPGYRVAPEQLPDGVRVHSIDMPALDISSTEIRRRVAARAAYRFLVPGLVAAYIDRYGLYRSADSPDVA